MKRSPTKAQNRNGSKGFVDFASLSVLVGLVLCLGIAGSAAAGTGDSKISPLANLTMPLLLVLPASAWAGLIVWLARGRTAKVRALLLALLGSATPFIITIGVLVLVSQLGSTWSGWAILIFLLPATVALSVFTLLCFALSFLPASALRHLSRICLVLYPFALILSVVVGLFSQI